MVHVNLKRTKFRRKDAVRFIRLGDKWRRPRGSKNNQLKRKRGQAAMPSIGYGSPKATRGLHPCGLRDILVYSLSDLVRLDKKKDAVRLGKSVGTRKRKIIIGEAKKLGLKVLNAGDLK